MAERYIDPDDPVFAPEAGKCSNCRGDLPPRKRRWCSNRCRIDAGVKIGLVRPHVFRRDRGVCANCGCDTARLDRVMFRAATSLGQDWPFWLARDKARSVLEEIGFTAAHPLWEADHIVPVSEGGGCCGLDGYRTLCVPCHKADNARLAAKRAAGRC